LRAGRLTVLRQWIRQGANQYLEITLRQQRASKSAPAAEAFAQRWFQAGCTMQNSSLRCERAIIESD
jgi:hypothetical protein